MTPEQEKWLADNPFHEVYRTAGIVAFHTWTDHAWLLSDGRRLSEEPRAVPYMNGAFSSGDTLYAAQPVLHVARRAAIV